MTSYSNNQRAAQYRQPVHDDIIILSWNILNRRVLERLVQLVPNICTFQKIFPLSQVVCVLFWQQPMFLLFCYFNLSILYDTILNFKLHIKIENDKNFMFYRYLYEKYCLNFFNMLVKINQKTSHVANTKFYIQQLCNTN